MIFQDARCIVLSCPSNHGEQGCACWFASHGLPCGHPKWRDQWRERMGYPALVDGNGHDPGPELVEIQSAQSLTARVSEAHRAADPVTPERVRQLVLAWESELSEVER